MNPASSSPSKAMQLATPTDTTIVITRTFDAPRRLVWEAMFTPDKMRRWMLPPPGWTATTLECDVRVLESARLVRRRVDGRQHLCRLQAAPLKEATHWTEQFRRNWEARFEALDSLLDEMKSAEQARARRP